MGCCAEVGRLGVRIAAIAMPIVYRWIVMRSPDGVVVFWYVQLIGLSPLGAFAGIVTNNAKSPGLTISAVVTGAGLPPI